jgi:hypothetical protein
MKENVYHKKIHILSHCHKTRKLVLRRVQELKVTEEFSPSKAGRKYSRQEILSALCTGKSTNPEVFPKIKTREQTITREKASSQRPKRTREN